MARKRHIDSGTCKGTIPVSIADSFIPCDDGSFQCIQCEMVISKKNNLARHVTRCKREKKNNNEKENKTKIQCAFCSFSCLYESKLIQHQKKHERETLTCTKCSKIYKRRDHYESHLERCDGSGSSCSQLVPSMSDHPYVSDDSMSDDPDAPNLFVEDIHQSYEQMNQEHEDYHICHENIDDHLENPYTVVSEYLDEAPPVIIIEENNADTSNNAEYEVYQDQNYKE